MSLERDTREIKIAISKGLAYVLTANRLRTEECLRNNHSSS